MKDKEEYFVFRARRGCFGSPALLWADSAAGAVHEIVQKIFGAFAKNLLLFRLILCKRQGCGGRIARNAQTTRRNIPCEIQSEDQTASEGPRKMRRIRPGRQEAPTASSAPKQIIYNKKEFVLS